METPAKLTALQQRHDQDHPTYSKQKVQWYCQSRLFFFLINNKNILIRRRGSPKYTRSIHQGQKQIKRIKYKSPRNHGLKKKNESLTLQPNPEES